MTIRKAEEKDILRIIELLGQVLQIHADIRPDIFIPGTTKYTVNELTELPNAVFLHQKGGRQVVAVHPATVLAAGEGAFKGHCYPLHGTASMIYHALVYHIHKLQTFVHCTNVVK